MVAVALTGSSFMEDNKNPLLSFSSLGCPDWSLDKMMDFAVAHGYKGLEIRGLQRQMDLTRCLEFNSPESRAVTLKRMEEKGLHFVGLGSSATLHFADPAERQKNLDEGKRFIDLAHQLNCPFVRVFPNNFPKGQDRETTMNLIIKGLLELANHAVQTNVSVLLETHGDLVKSTDLKEIMVEALHPKTGLVWDVSNMWTVTRESPAEVYKNLKPFIRHTHIKDAVMLNGKMEYKFVGRGEVPIFEAVDILRKDGYNGYYSFEWEKMWHPELAEPELALADYSVTMQNHFKQM